MKKKVQKKKDPDILKFWREVQEKSDNKIKGYLDIQRAKSDEDTKRYLGALSEDFQSKVSAMTEQFLGLNKKIDDNTNKLEFKMEGFERKMDSPHRNDRKTDGRC